MIDWRKRALVLAKVVNCHRKDRMHKDMLRSWVLAGEIIRLEKLDRKANKKFMEWWKCEDKKKAAKLHDEYLELVRECC